MPTKRFIHLSNDKKSAILKAAVDEFSRVPFEKASINQIIQNAGISRGSFYTYFEDKRDVLNCIFHDSASKLQQFCEERLEAHGGDVWETLEELLAYCMDIARSGKMFQMSRHVMAYQDMEHIFDGGGGGACAHKEAAGSLLASLYEKTDKTGFRIQSREEFRLFLEVVMVGVLMALGEYYKQPERAENIKKLFHKKLEIIRYGVCKQSVQ